MDQKQINTFREALLALRQELEQLSNTGKQASDTVTLDQSKVGRLSRMDALQAQQMAQEVMRRRQIQLQSIDSALRRIKAGEYGYCLSCGDEVGTGRLNFDPASSHCIGCADA